MCDTSLLQRNFSNLAEPLSFPTLQLLRTRSRLRTTSGTTDPTSYCNSIKIIQAQPQMEKVLLHDYEMEKTPLNSPILDVMGNTNLEHLPADIESTTNILLQTEMPRNKSDSFIKPIELDCSKLPSNNNNTFALPNISMLPLSGPSAALLNHAAVLPAFEYLTPGGRTISPVDLPLMELNRVGGIFPSFLHRRSRGEKRPIPEEQKDDKYYERRKRNNEAAKKSRDARKMREDRIAFRAAFLEQENSLLRAQVMALRDELQRMRQIIGRTSLSHI